MRLYPAFWACCTLTFVIVVLIGGDRFSASIGQYLVNMTMLSGFVGVPSIDGVYWSLFIELQFYGMVAVLLIVGRIHQAQFFLVVWLLLTIALEVFPIGPLRFLLLTDYSAYFIAGAMSFLVWSRGMSMLPRCARSLLPGASRCTSPSTASRHFEKHYGTAHEPVRGRRHHHRVLRGHAAGGDCGAPGRWAHRRWLTAGALTYPLYLIHQNIGFMIFNAAYPAINTHVLFWGTVLLMLGTAYAVHVLIERRFSPALTRLAREHLGRTGERSRPPARLPCGQAPSWRDHQPRDRGRLSQAIRAPGTCRDPSRHPGLGAIIRPLKPAAKATRYSDRDPRQRPPDRRSGSMHGPAPTHRRG